MLGLSGSGLSKEFFDFAKAIGEARSKQEEDRIICSEIVLLKSRFQEPNATVKQLKEYLIRAIYIEMLGHDASFAHIHAVKLAHEKNILCKRTGYLACNLFLNHKDELMLLLINTIQKDLKSDNFLEVWAALNCVCRLINQEMIPGIFPIIKNLIHHKNELIRKKVCMLLHKIYLLDSSILKELDGYLKKLLCDVDPSVMGASLNLIHEIAKNDKTYCINLIPYLVSIMKQINENKLPREYEYHRIPSPWVQIKILTIFRILGFSNKKVSEQIYEILQRTMEKADIGINVGYAIIYECVKTIASIYPSHHLLELASLSISRFISSENHNLKYVGVTGLALIVKINPLYAHEHQLVVVDCLEDKDETLKMKTLDLLYQMTNPVNVQIIVDKLLFHMENSLDLHFKKDMACKIIQLIERFAPDDQWYLDKINSVFLLVGNMLDESYSYSLIKLLKEGPMMNIDCDIPPSSNTDENRIESNVMDDSNENKMYDISTVDKEEGDSKEETNKEILDEIKKENCSSSSSTKENKEKEEHNIKKENDDSNKLRKYAVHTYIKMLEKEENIPLILIQVICWVLGEYSHLCDIENITTENIIELLNNCLEKSFDNAARVKSCIITSIFKLCCSHNLSDHDILQKILHKYKNSEVTELQQKCYEYENILKNPELTKYMFPCPNEKKQILMDPNLSFLDSFIEKYIQEGGKVGTPRVQRERSFLETSQSGNSELNFVPYESPSVRPFTNETEGLPSWTSVEKRPLENLGSFKNESVERTEREERNRMIEQRMKEEEKEKKLKLNVVGPKKWSRKVKVTEKKKKRKKKKKKTSGSEELEQDQSKSRRGSNENEEEMEEESEYNENKNSESMMESEEEYTESENEEESIKRTDSLESDYKNYERFEESIYNMKEERDGKNSLPTSLYGQSRASGSFEVICSQMNEHEKSKTNINNNRVRGPSKPRELTEREKMAAALFSGLVPNDTSIKHNRYQDKEEYKIGIQNLNKANNGFLQKGGKGAATPLKNILMQSKGKCVGGFKIIPGEKKNLMKNGREPVPMTVKIHKSNKSQNVMIPPCINNISTSDKMKKMPGTFEMLNCSVSSKEVLTTNVNNKNTEMAGSLGMHLKFQRKAVFRNSNHYNLFDTIKKIENEFAATVDEVFPTKSEAVVSCTVNSCSVFLQIKIDPHKIIVSVKSDHNNIIENIMNSLKNLFI